MAQRRDVLMRFHVFHGARVGGGNDHPSSRLYATVHPEDLRTPFRKRINPLSVSLSRDDFCRRSFSDDEARRSCTWSNSSWDGSRSAFHTRDLDRTGSIGIRSILSSRSSTIKGRFLPFLRPFRRRVPFDPGATSMDRTLPFVRSFERLEACKRGNVRETKISNPRFSRSSITPSERVSYRHVCKHPERHATIPFRAQPRSIHGNAGRTSRGSEDPYESQAWHPKFIPVPRRYKESKEECNDPHVPSSSSDG